MPDVGGNFPFQSPPPAENTPKLEYKITNIWKVLFEHLIPQLAQNFLSNILQCFVKFEVVSQLAYLTNQGTYS